MDGLMKIIEYMSTKCRGWARQVVNSYMNNYNHVERKIVPPFAEVFYLDLAAPYLVSPVWMNVLFPFLLQLHLKRKGAY